MTEPTDEQIAAWADAFIQQRAYNRAVAVQIAMEAAKWVRGQRVHVGWYHEAPALGTKGLHGRMSDADLAEWRRVAHVWPVYRVEREALPGDSGATENQHHKALQCIGTALGLMAGADLHRECVPAIERLRAAAGLPEGDKC